MALEQVREYFRNLGMEERIMELEAEEVLEYTGHPVGGVCPFGLPGQMAVYLDVSLKRFDEVIPAAGSNNSSIRLSIKELELHSGFREWVDVCGSV